MAPSSARPNVLMTIVPLARPARSMHFEQPPPVSEAERVELHSEQVACEIMADWDSRLTNGKVGKGYRGVARDCSQCLDEVAQFSVHVGLGRDGFLHFGAQHGSVAVAEAM